VHFPDFREPAVECRGDAPCSFSDLEAVHASDSLHSCTRISTFGVAVECRDDAPISYSDLEAVHAPDTRELVVECRDDAPICLSNSEAVHAPDSRELAVERGRAFFRELVCLLNGHSLPGCGDLCISELCSRLSSELGAHPGYMQVLAMVIAGTLPGVQEAMREHRDGAPSIWSAYLKGVIDQFRPLMPL
jgi:hypothetical protein